MDLYRNTAYKVWHDLWCLQLKHSLSASNFKAEIALVFKCKALSIVYYMYMYVGEKMQRLNNIYLGQGLHCSQVTNYACFSVVCWFFFSNQTWIFFRNTCTIKVLNSLDPDQARHLVAYDLGPTCLQRLSAADTYAITAKFHEQVQMRRWFSKCVQLQLIICSMQASLETRRIHRCTYRICMQWRLRRWACAHAQSPHAQI